MKLKRKRILGILFSLAMIFGMSLAMSATAYAATAFEAEDHGSVALPASPGSVLTNGNVYCVEQDRTIAGNATAATARERSALIVDSGATVYIYIPSGVTLNVTGADASDGGNGRYGVHYTGNGSETGDDSFIAQGGIGAGAGIYVPADASLYLIGKGKITAAGGKAGKGGNGGDGKQGSYNVNNDYYGQYLSGPGGGGGAGGGGSAAAIGGAGGNGGKGGAIAAAQTAGTMSLAGNNGGNGESGSPGTDCGNINISSSVSVNATNGASSNHGTGGSAGAGASVSNASHAYLLGGGGGGGGGAAGSAANGESGIGGGGAGGAGGGAGGSGGNRSNTDAQLSDLQGEGGNGGQGGGGNGLGTKGNSGGAAGSGGAQASAGNNGTVTQDATAAKTYEISYTAPEGSGTPTSVVAYYTLAKSGQTITTPTFTTNEGYRFNGWDLTTYAKSLSGTPADLTQEYSGTISPNTKITIPDDAAGSIAFSANVTKLATEPVLEGPDDVEMRQGESDREVSVKVLSPTTGHVLSYLWQESSNGTDFYNIPGNQSNRSSYTIPEDTSLGKHYYRCVVTATLEGSSESATTTSKACTVKVGKSYPNDTIWNIGDSINLRGDWFLNSPGSTTKYRSVDADSTVPSEPNVDGATVTFDKLLPADKTIDAEGTEIDFPGGLRSDIVAEIPSDMQGLDIVGIKLASGTGTVDNPYIFEAVFAYPLWVDGVHVTSANKDNVLKGDSVNDGKVSFTPAEGETPATLTLNGANITSGHKVEMFTNGIYYNGTDPLTINLQSGSENSIRGVDRCIYSGGNRGGALTLSGGGSLNASTDAYYGIGIYAHDALTIEDCTVNVEMTGNDGMAILAESNSGVITIDGGTVNASATGASGLGIRSYSDDVVIKSGSEVTAVGGLKAIDGNVKNSVAGTGWTNTAGTEGEAAIKVSGSDGQTLDYKKVQFPEAAEPVNVTLNYCAGHTGLFSKEEGTLDDLKDAVGAKGVYMLKDDTTIILEGVSGSMTEAELRTILDEFVRGLKGEDDWLIDNEELYAAVGYKPLDNYETMQEVAEDIGEESTKHDVPIKKGLTYYLLWAKAIDNIQLDNGNPICGKEAESSMPKAPAGTIIDDKESCWYDEDGDEVDTFEGGREYICKVEMEIDPNGALWKNYFSDDLTKVTVKGGQVVKIDADTPGELYVKFTATADHDWDEGTVTKQPTTTEDGEKVFRCKTPDCEGEKTEVIPKLNPAASTFITKLATKGKNSLRISWNKVKGADGYDIFFAPCNKNGKKMVCKNVKSIKGNNAISWTKSGLKKGTAYKAYVKAYVMENGQKKYISTSPQAHAYAGGHSKKFTNAKSVTVKKAKVSLKKGKTYKIKAKVKKLKKGKKLMPKSHVAKLRYKTSNAKVATVSKSGKITAKGKGTCRIYVYAHNGVSKSIKVTVK